MFEVGAIAIIGVLGAMSPGPDFAIVTKNALTQSRLAGYFTALGIAAGLLMHSIYCVLGLAIIISQSVIMFHVLHVVGAAYLIYIGIKNLNTKNFPGKSIIAASTFSPQTQRSSQWQAFQQGFLVNALNPKCILFLLTVFSTVIKPGTSTGMQVVYALEIVFTGLGWFCLLTFLLTHHKVKASLDRFQNSVVKLLGIFLIGFGLSLLVSVFSA